MNDRIIVIDDKEDVCDIITQFLTHYSAGNDQSYFVCEQYSVLNGIKTLREDEPYGVAIIDMSFDNFDGTDEERKVAGMKVVEAALDVPFLESIVLTAYPTVQTASDSIAKGVFRYVVKNGSWLPELANVVELALLNREVMMTVSECLVSARQALDALTGIGPQASVDEAQLCLSTAEKAFRRVLRARGRHPDQAHLVAQ